MRQPKRKRRDLLSELIELSDSAKVEALLRRRDEEQQRADAVEAFLQEHGPRERIFLRPIRGTVQTLEGKPTLTGALRIDFVDGVAFSEDFTFREAQ